MSNAYRDENDVPTLIAVSSLDGRTPVRLWADPVTHRLLVDVVNGLVELTATGVVNGINRQFTFTTEPTYIVSDGVWYKPLDNNGNTQWSWSAGTLTATMTIPPTSAIFGIA
jgi:hypothetical protein